MAVSARNVFKGTITAITHGAINAEVAITTEGGDTIIATVTEDSVKSLGLEIGKPATAYTKAPWVMLVAGENKIRFSTRNQLSGMVTSLIKGGINTEVAITLAGDSVVYAVITNEAVMELGLKLGKAATALIKASHVIIGV